MTASVKRVALACVLAGACAALFPQVFVRAAGPVCDPDNGGLTLPTGFCALVVADGLGAARHLVVAPNGDAYVALRSGGVVALRDADGDGRFEIKEKFGSDSTTGIVLRNGYLYVAHPQSVQRYKMTPGQLKPAGEPETIVTDLPSERSHADKGLAFDDRGSLYINVGAPSNACQQPDRRPGVKGVDPCPLLVKHGGIWKFDENKAGQKQEDGTRFATGLRQMPAITWHDGAVYIVMNSRDQLDVFWPDHFTAKDNAERPAEPMFRAVQGSDFGWPYCFFDYGSKKFLLNPEYGGDGRDVGRCGSFTVPVAAFPAHWAPVDVMFYSGLQFPKKYEGGAFVAFHGSWNRAPMPQDGYNVTFQPFANGKPSGDFEVFARGFAGKDPLMNPGDAVARANGVAQGPDGSLYIAESQKGRVWRVLYTALQAADRPEITFADGRIFPESLTSTRDGAVYFGSVGLDSVYRAAPDSSVARPWIAPKANGLQQVLGVLADEAAGTLWVCVSATGGRGGAPLVGETALKAFALKDASFKGSYAFPNNGLCNDIAVAKDGTVYATDTIQARVLRLKKGASALDVWAADPALLSTADGIALLDDGAVYVNSVGQGFLARIPVQPDGSAGAIARLEASQPLSRPDGMRSVGSHTMLLVEGAGRLDEVTISGNRAEIKVLRDGLTGPTAVTLVGDTAYVSEARLNLRMSSEDPGPFRAVGIPYRAPK